MPLSYVRKAVFSVLSWSDTTGSSSRQCVPVSYLRGRALSTTASGFVVCEALLGLACQSTQVILL